MLAKPARASLQRDWTAAGFFEYLYDNTTGSAKTDAVSALSVFNHGAASSLAGVQNFTIIGNAYDASSLYCMYAGLTYLDYCNSIRAARGLSPFGTNCTMMAMSIVMCNYSQYYGGHSNAYSSNGVHEALAWGGGQRNPASVYQSWYYNESDSGSHRRNVIGNYNASGFAIAARGSGTMSYMYEQSFLLTSSGAKVYSISEFRSILKAYILECLAEGMPLGSLSSSEFSGISTPTVKNGLYVENGVTHGYVNGTMLVNSWGQFGGVWYYFGATGAMQTNTWISYGGEWYYLGSNGAMATSTWVAFGNAWYWLDASGAMATDTWIAYRGAWYYLGASGAMATNTWVFSAGSWYYLGADGTMTVNAWVGYGGKWFLMGSDGAPVTDTWYKSGGNWYYLQADGSLAVDTWVQYAGTWYRFDSYGRLAVA